MSLINNVSGAFLIQAKNSAEFNTSQLFLTTTYARGGDAFSAPSAFNTLTVTEDYAGIGGALEMNGVQKGENGYLTNQETPVTPQPASEAGLDLITASVPQINSTRKPEAVCREAGSYIANFAATNTLFTMNQHDQPSEPGFIDALSAQPEATCLWLRQPGVHNACRDDSGALRTQRTRYAAQIDAQNPDDIRTGRSPTAEHPGKYWRSGRRVPPS